MLQERRVHVPALAERDVTVTEVRMSPDLKAATAFVTPLGGGDVAGTLEDLGHAAPAIRHELARELNLRFTPRLSFQPDRSFDEAQKVDRILRSERVRRDTLDADAAVRDEDDDGQA
jgi:ribosome-binding factor A